MWEPLLAVNFSTNLLAIEPMRKQEAFKVPGSSELRAHVALRVWKPGDETSCLAANRWQHIKGGTRRVPGSEGTLAVKRSGNTH